MLFHRLLFRLAVDSVGRYFRIKEQQTSAQVPQSNEGQNILGQPDHSDLRVVSDRNRLPADQLEDTELRDLRLEGDVCLLHHLSDLGHCAADCLYCQTGEKLQQTEEQEVQEGIRIAVLRPEDQCWSKDSFHAELLFDQENNACCGCVSRRTRAHLASVPFDCTGHCPD